MISDRIELEPPRYEAPTGQPRYEAPTGQPTGQPRYPQVDKPQSSPPPPTGQPVIEVKVVRPDRPATDPDSEPPSNLGVDSKSSENTSGDKPA